MSMDILQSAPRVEHAKPFGSCPERDTAILNAALGGMLLVNLEPAEAVMATEPGQRVPTGITLFPPPKSRSRASLEKPISDLGLARHDQPLMVVGLPSNFKMYSANPTVCADVDLSRLYRSLVVQMILHAPQQVYWQSRACPTKVIGLSTATGLC